MPPKSNPNWVRGPPLSFLLLPLPSIPSRTRKGGSPTPTRRKTPPPLARLERAGQPPPPSFIYMGRGVPRTHKLIVVLAVCGAPLHRFPPWSYRCSA